MFQDSNVSSLGFFDVLVILIFFSRLFDVLVLLVFFLSAL